MFYHNFKYSLKILLKNKSLIFWTFAFPILLGTLFNMAFSNIEKSEKLSIIDIAIINSDEFDNYKIFKETMQTLSDDNNKNKIFNITYTDISKAKKLLLNEEITGYLKFNENNIDIIVNSSGINETILRSIVDEIEREKEVINTLVKKETEKGNIDYTAIYNRIALLLNNSNATLKDISNKNLSYTMIEYYTLVAMAVLYGALISMNVVNYKLANMNSVGKRTAVSKVGKGKLLLGSLLASYIVQMLSLLILLVYTIFVLKVDYGSDIMHVILLIAIGSLASLTLGLGVSTMLKTNENAKTGILIAITMLWSTLSGMMGITTKYVIDKNIPILNILNPANMITDAFYSLYYYDTLNRFYSNIISLLVFSLIMIIISYESLRRQKYDSI
jgi:ABC-2 type transport system permease protein